MPRPQPDSYPTAWSYFWAHRRWKRKHGGSLIGTLAIAVFFGGFTGSPVLLLSLVVFVLVGTAYARSRP